MQQRGARDRQSLRCEGFAGYTQFALRQIDLTLGLCRPSQYAAKVAAGIFQTFAAMLEAVQTPPESDFATIIVSQAHAILEVPLSQ